MESLRRRFAVTGSYEKGAYYIMRDLAASPAPFSFARSHASSSASKPPATRPASRCTTPRAACSPTRCTPRSRCTPITAASCPSSPRATTSGALLPLTRAGARRRPGSDRGDIDAIAYTAGPGLAGALLVGASAAHGLALRAAACRRSALHHLEGHLLSPLLADARARFPVRRAAGLGRPHAAHARRRRRRLPLLGETLDDAAGEAFDKTAKLLGLAYPGGPALARLAEQGRPGRFKLPRPMLESGDLDFSFSGLKTAVADRGARRGRSTTARAPTSPPKFQAAIVDVLVAKSLAALERDRPRRGSWSPAASARTRGCASGSPRGARAPGCTRVLSRRSRSAPTTAR